MSGRCRLVISIETVRRSFMTAKKLGLILAAIHTVLVFGTFAWSLAAGHRLAVPAWFLLYSIDLPAQFFLLLFDTFPVPVSYPWQNFTLFVLLFATVGGTWWFLIGLGLNLCHSRLDTRSPALRFVSALAIVLIVVIVVWGVQFFFTIPSIAHDGCASAGVPVPFFRGCYGVLSWYWGAMSVSKGALAVDAIVWILTALLICGYHGRKLSLADVGKESR